jgi:hypothetical protein
MSWPSRASNPRRKICSAWASPPSLVSRMPGASLSMSAALARGICASAPTSMSKSAVPRLRVRCLPATVASRRCSSAGSGDGGADSACDARSAGGGGGVAGAGEAFLVSGAGGGGGGTKVIGTRMRLGTATPSLLAGEKTHCLIAAMAASSKASPPELTTVTSPTFPSASMGTARTTWTSWSSSWSSRPWHGKSAATRSMTWGGVAAVDGSRGGSCA